MLSLGVGVAISGPQAATNSAKPINTTNHLYFLPIPLPFRFCNGDLGPEIMLPYNLESKTYNSTRRNRSELLTTKILLKAIAPAARTGCNRMPNHG